MELRGISGQGEGNRTSQREPISVPCPKKAMEMDVKHPGPGNVWAPTGSNWNLLSPLLPHSYLPPPCIHMGSFPYHQPKIEILPCPKGLCCVIRGQTQTMSTKQGDLPNLMRLFEFCGN